EPADARLLRERRDLGHVSAELGADLMRVKERSARKLELATRLEGNACAVAEESDEGPALGLELGLPTLPGELLEEGANAAFVVVGNGCPVRVDPELFHLRADAKRRCGLDCPMKEGKKIVVRNDR